MLIFVANIPVYIHEKAPDLAFDFVANLEMDEVAFKKIKGKVLLQNASFREILAAMEFLQKNPMAALEQLNFTINDKLEFKKFLKENVQVIKAAGGIVQNNLGEILLIKRLGFWDLPKGKAEKKEKSEVTALREVEEECGVTASIDKKVACTWHTYYMKKVLVLKKTKWYAMDLNSDQNMKPQMEEGIEELRWMDKQQWLVATENTYKSIKYVLKNWEDVKCGLIIGKKNL